MNVRIEEPKSCDPQLSDQRPTEEWGVDELGEYAQSRHQEIEANEESLALTYWGLGLALNLARQKCSHGRWAAFLAQLRIDKTRASKARAIQRSFATEQAVAGMSVQEAYRRRKRKIQMPSAKKNRRKGKSQGAGIVDWLIDVCSKVDFYLDEVESADTEEAATLLPVVENAVEELTRLRSRVEQRVDTL